MQWYRVDLHLHTPASSDYQESEVTYLDILRKAEFRGLDIIAFTDHNTVAGWATMLQEIEHLEYLENLDRAQPDELRTLNEFRRLMDKVLVLPGFEFTATFGFHILGLFAPETPTRQLEHLLLSLNVPLETLDVGSSQVGASADVLRAYQVINEAGGICIAAHAKSTLGVALGGVVFGGNTRMDYTQNPFLHAL
jgi:PHP family Zn ribbon phosphoesterase